MRDLATRFRLEKIDPSAARSSVKKPIIFYIDRGAPEPIRTALREGVSWWNSAFDAAGFVDAFRAEILPAGADPLDVRYSVVNPGQPGDTRLVLWLADRRSTDRRDHQGLGPARLAPSASGHD